MKYSFGEKFLSHEKWMKMLWIVLCAHLHSAQSTDRVEFERIYKLETIEDIFYLKEFIQRIIVPHEKCNIVC